MSFFETPPPQGRPHDYYAKTPPGPEPETLLRRFVNAEGERLRYVPAWGRWMVWNGKVWRPDDRGTVLEAARVLCGEAKAQAGAAALLERRARAAPALHAEAEEWDADPWLLNTPNDIIDLRTGERKKADPRFRLTKMTRAMLASAVDRDKPKAWQRFLHDVTGGDAELVAYLKRLTGYLLTGSAVEHGLFLIVGSGANGKSVFLNTLFAVLGDYARPVASDLFLKGARRPGILGDLRAVRLAAAQEIEPGRQWAEARLKALTGGDRVMVPRNPDGLETSAKFLLIANQLPDVSAVDEAIRRRLHVIHFARTVPPEERDPWLLDKIMAEASWVLRWMVEGCLEWQRHGLGRPAAISEASEQYLDTQDALGAWLGACCGRDPDARATYAELYDSWRGWAKAAGEPVGSPRALFKALAAKGFRRLHSDKVREFGGIALHGPTESSVPSVPPVPADLDHQRDSGPISVPSVPPVPPPAG